MKFFAVHLLLILTASSAFAFKGYVYELNSNRKKLLYTIERENIINGTKESLRLRFIQPDGTLAVEELALFENDKLTKYTVDYPRRKHKGVIGVKDGKIDFSYTKEDKTKTDDEKYVDNFIVGLSMDKFIKANWDKLVSGEKLKTRFGVSDRRETVGFSLFRIKDKEKEEGLMVVKMKPTSWIISALVDPVILHFDLKSKDLIYFVGRTKPKQLIKGKWKDLDAETVYDWERDKKTVTKAD